MNKIIYALLIPIFFVFSCSKEKVNQSTPTQIKGSVRMLEFSSPKEYDETIELLVQKMDKWNDDFVSKYSALTVDELNEKEDEIGFNDQQPLIDFEKSKGFSSMRQAFFTEEEEWLNHEELDPALDPSNRYSFSEEEMALLNKEGEVKIGESILKLTENGYIEFTDGDIDKLDRYNNGDLSVLSEPGVKTNIEMERSSGCKAWIKKKNTHYYAPKKYVKRHVHFHAYPWKGTSDTRIVSYKKKRKRWRRYRMRLGVANQNYFYDSGDCDNIGIGGFSGWKRKTRKSLNKHFADWNAFPTYRAKNGASVLGSFEYAGFAYSMWLSW